MLWVILGIQIVIVTILVLIYKDMETFTNAIGDRQLLVGKSLERRLKHLVKYVDLRMEQRMYDELFAFKQKALDGYYGEEEREEWRTNPFTKEFDFKDTWKKESWAPFSHKLYEEED